MHVDVEAELTSCGRTCYSNYFQVYVYRGNSKLNIPSDQNNKKGTKDFLITNFTPVYNITNDTTSKTTNKKEHQTFGFYQNGSKVLIFAIRSTGACGKIYRMKMYYYYCEETFINSIKFPETISPASRSREVYGKCSVNSAAPKNEANLKGFCQSNGTWSINYETMCLCLEGYEPTPSNGCSRKFITCNFLNMSDKWDRISLLQPDCVINSKLT